MKTALVGATLVTHPHQDASTSLITDASDQVVGAISQQSVNGVMVPLAFLSKKLPQLQMNYSVFD